jgi:tetratricopeptide (TPR) repeat protein
MRWLDLVLQSESKSTVCAESLGHEEKRVMKRTGWNFGGVVATAALAILSVLTPSRVLAQAEATLHGHVNNPAGQPIGKGEVRLTTDRSSDAKGRKYQYTFPLEANGDYKGAGITPGTYVAIVFQDDKSIDFVDSVPLAAGEDKTVNFDMTRKEYVDKMTPEERKALEDFKKKNAEVTAGNQKIANLNNLLVQARADTKSGNFDAAITAMTSATVAKPDEAILWVTLGDAQLGSADAAVKAAKTAGTSPTDPALVQKFTDAETSYKKAIDLNAASKKPSPETAAASYNQLGQAFGKSGHPKESADAYEMAAKAQPTQAATYYFNEAATLYNASDMDNAAAAADKAIAADPKRADAYYIKGQALIPKATVDKAGKIVAPPGCVEAYQQYLELAPTGPHAEDVKGILAGIGAQVKSSYKAPKK